MNEARICMTCGNMDCFNNGRCSECGSNDIMFESQFPTVRGNEYPTYEELKAFRSYTRSDWKWEVMNGDTVLGYNDWVLHQMEADKCSTS